MELMIVIAVLAILALIIVPRFFNYTKKVDAAKNEANCRIVKEAAIVVDDAVVPFGELGYKEKVGEYANIPKNELPCYIIEKDEKGDISVDYNCDGVEITGPDEVIPTLYTIELEGSDFMFDMSTRTITEYTKENVEMLTVPDTFIIEGELYEVLTIGKGAFKNKGIKEVVLSKTLIEIHEDAFFGNNIEKVSFGTSVEFIGESAFFQNAFTELEFPNSVKTIDKKVFMQNTAISIVTFGSGLEEIGENAFKGTSIKEITIPGSVKVIGKNAFDGTKYLEKITIGAGVLMDKKEFGNNFQSSYQAGGAGTYLLINNKEWVKQ